MLLTSFLIYSLHKREITKRQLRFFLSFRRIFFPTTQRKPFSYSWATETNKRCSLSALKTASHASYWLLQPKIALHTKLQRTIFNWVSKVIRNFFDFVWLRSVISPENRRHHITQSDSILKPTYRDLVTRVFPRFRQFVCLYLKFWLAPGNFFLATVSCCDCFRFCLWTHNRKAL